MVRNLKIIIYHIIILSASYNIFSFIISNLNGWYLGNEKKIFYSLYIPEYNDKAMLSKFHNCKF